MMHCQNCGSPPGDISVPCPICGFFSVGRLIIHYGSGSSTKISISTTIGRDILRFWLRESLDNFSSVIYKLESDPNQGWLVKAADSSRNVTYINNNPLMPGAHHKLITGDKISIDGNKATISIEIDRS